MSNYHYPEWFSEKTFKFYQKKIKQLRKATYVHSESADYYSKLHLRIYAPSIVITGISGIASFLSSSSIFNKDAQTGIAIGVGILASVSAMIQSLASAVDYSTKAKSHREAADEFEKLITKIEFEMEMPNEEDFLNNLEQQILDIQSKCKYFPPKYITIKYDKTHNYEEPTFDLNNFTTESSSDIINSNQVVINIDNTETEDEA